MKWDEIKAKYPSKWVVIEALEAHDSGDKRVIDESSVVNVFDESMAAFREYRALHKLNPNREFLFISTTTDQLQIPTHPWAGLRR